jgi:hypothetical protein
MKPFIIPRGRWYNMLRTCIPQMGITALRYTSLRGNRKCTDIIYFYSVVAFNLTIISLKIITKTYRDREIEGIFRTVCNWSLSKIRSSITFGVINISILVMF